MMDTSHDWDNELHRLAGTIAAPAVPVEDDLARGRRRARRHRLSAVGAVAATATVIAGTAWLATPDPRASDSPDVAVTTTTEPTPAPPEDRVLPLVDLEEEVFEPSNIATLQAWRDVLAEHLDPPGTHLEKKPSNEQTGGGAEGQLTLGTKLGWSIPGEPGLGVVQVSVSNAAEEGHWDCGNDPAWACHDATAPGGLRAQVAVHDGVRAVRVTRADGEVVMLSVDNLFGNNSTVPVSGMDVDEADLLAAAADPRLTLPDKVVEHELPDYVEPPTEQVLSSAIQRRLAGPGETLEVTSLDGAYVEAVLTRDGVRQGRLIISVGQKGGEGPRCLRAEFAGCVERTVGPRTVFIGRFKPGQPNNPAWTVVDPGPVRTVTVTFLAEGTGTDDPDDAVALVVAPELQE